MKAVVPASLLLGMVLAGCADDPANPNLLAPKVLVQPRPDGNVTVYVHSAFGEHDYDWLSLSLDNHTLANRTAAFSLEEQVRGEGFFLHVQASAAGETFEVRARVDLDLARDKARVALLDPDGEWNEPRAYNLPFEAILGRVRPEVSA